MSPVFSAVLLLSLNLGLLWLLMAAPVGTRTIRIRRTFRATPAALWQAVDPAGAKADWHHSVLTSKCVADRPGVIEQTYKNMDRKGRPVRRLFAVTSGGEHVYDARIVDDSTLDSRFWRDYQEHREVITAPEGSTLVVEQTDRYRGLAFFLFRYFALRREMRALKGWLETGTSQPNGIFERPLTQVGMAVFSTLLLWPFLGLNASGLMISCFLTVVIVLHELGHMAAYRTFGHTSTRMIFIPLLGGVAIGGRPYNSLFEIATCALMGPGMSGFLVPILVAGHEAAQAHVLPAAASGPLLVFLLILGAFNLLNLLPMYRFDGGQILRQIFRSRVPLMAASFGITLAILFVGWRIGLSGTALLAGLTVFTLMSLIGSRSVKPKEALEDMSGGQRLLVGFGLYAAVMIHAYAVAYAANAIF